jgi:hypothetical protein
MVEPGHRVAEHRSEQETTTRASPSTRGSEGGELGFLERARACVECELADWGWLGDMGSRAGVHAHYSGLVSGHAC